MVTEVVLDAQNFGYFKWNQCLGLNYIYTNIWWESIHLAHPELKKIHVGSSVRFCVYSKLGILYSLKSKLLSTPCTTSQVAGEAVHRYRGSVR